MEVRSLEPIAAIWRHRSGSTLTQIMVLCRQTTSLLIIGNIQYHSSEGNLPSHKSLKSDAILTENWSVNVGNSKRIRQTPIQSKSSVPSHTTPYFCYWSTCSAVEKRKYESFVSKMISLRSHVTSDHIDVFYLIVCHYMGQLPPVKRTWRIVKSKCHIPIFGSPTDKILEIEK